MNQQEEHKRKPVLTILAGIFSFFSFLALVFIIAIINLQNTTMVYITVALAVSLTGLIFAITCKNERRRVAFRIVLPLNIVITSAVVFSSLLGLFQIGMKEHRDEQQNYIYQRARNLSDVEYVKTLLPETNYIFYSMPGDYSPSSHWYFHDTEGKIIAQFKSMEFTLTEFEETPELSSTYFYDTSECSVRFFKDYSGVVVSSDVKPQGLHSGDIRGYSFTNRYTVDVNEGEKLRDLIDSIFKEQVQTYRSEEQAVKDTLTIESTINDLKGYSNRLSCDYRKQRPDDTIETKYDYDDNRILLDALSNADFSNSTLSDSEFPYINNGFVYTSVKTGGVYIIKYSHDRHFILIEKYYTDFLGRERKTGVVYTVDDEVGNQIFAAAAAIFSNKQ